MNSRINNSLERASCCVGCDVDDEELFTAHDLLHNIPGEFSVVKCRACGLIRTNPRPTPETIAQYYPDNYGPYLGTKVNADSEVSGGSFRKYLKPLINRIFDFKGTSLPPMKPGRMLEIGCASGSFLHHMANKGWKVQGIEFSEKAALEAQKLGYFVHVGPLENAPKPEEKFNLFVGWMVLEHLHEPVKSLKKMSEWAAPGARLALSVPNARSVEFRLFKGNGFALQLPTHLYHFTPETIEKVLFVGGWRVDRIFHQRTLSNFIGSLGYLMRDRGFIAIGDKMIKFTEQGGVLVYILFPLSWVMGQFGQTGRMTVWASKLNDQ